MAASGSVQRATPPGKAEFKMPRPPAVVVWRNAPGGDANYAIVTQYGKHAVSLMVFAPESRVGVPKSGVRYVDDPWNTTQGINSESGVWDYTDESKQLAAIKATLAEIALKSAK